MAAAVQDGRHRCPLPFQTQVSGSFSSFPGNSESITYGVTRTIYPQLVQTSITVPLDDPSDPDRYFDRGSISWTCASPRRFGCAAATPH